MDNAAENKANKSLLITLSIVVIAVIALAIVGFLFLNKPEPILEGQVEGTTLRMSGKLPGRIANFSVTDGDTVKAGTRSCASTQPWSRHSSPRPKPCRT